MTPHFRFCATEKARGTVHVKVQWRKEQEWITCGKLHLPKHLWTLLFKVLTFGSGALIRVTQITGAESE